MPINVIYSAGNSFSPVTVTGKRIFDLSVNARVPKASMPHFFVAGVQHNISTDLPDSHVQILPPHQMHLTVINPVFKMEPDKGPIPGDEEAGQLFGSFERIMKSSQVASLLASPIKVSFDSLVFRERDIKLCGESKGLEALREGLSVILKGADERFDFAEGMPGTFITVARFGPGISKSDYRSIRSIMERAAVDIDEPLDLNITHGNLSGVMFTGLFMPWEREFSFDGSSDS